nr:hypothetical protein [Pyrobaculum sp.]
MEGAEVEYRAVLSLIYADMASDLDDVVIVFENSPSCISMASAITALLMARGKRVEAVPAAQFRNSARHALFLMGPYRNDLAEAVASLLPYVERVAILHTPAYYAVEELADFPKLIEGKEVRYAVREDPGEITIYKVTAREGELKKSEVARRKLSATGLKIIRRYEMLNST